MADDPLLDWLLRLGTALDSAEIPFALAGGLEALDAEVKLDRAYLLRQAKALRLLTRLKRALPSL